MSKSDEDWRQLRARAFRIRAGLRNVLDDLEFWEFSAVAESVRWKLEKGILELLPPADELIGTSSPDWLEPGNE